MRCSRRRHAASRHVGAAELRRYNDFDTPDWSDGKYLYRMAQGPRLPFTQPDMHIVHDPYLIVYNLVEPPSK